MLMDLHAFYVLCVQKTVPQGETVYIHIDTVQHKRVERLYIECWSRVVFTNGSVLCCPQRDVFNQLLIHAAMKSENKHHQKLGRWSTTGILQCFSLLQFQCCAIYCLFLCERLLRDYSREKKKERSCTIWSTGFHHDTFCWGCCPLERSLVAVFPRPYRTQAVCSHYVTNIPCLYTMLYVHYWSG